MSDLPAVQYATNGDVHLAYQVAGRGPRDIVFIWGPLDRKSVV